MLLLCSLLVGLALDHRNVLWLDHGTKILVIGVDWGVTGVGDLRRLVVGEVRDAKGRVN